MEFFLHNSLVTRIEAKLSEGQTSEYKFIPFQITHRQFKPPLVRPVLLNNSHILLFTKDVFLKSAMVSDPMGSKVVFPYKN